MMHYELLSDSQALARRAADALTEVIASDHPVLALATGRTPEPVYAELVRRYRQGRLDFSRAVTFNLDEYGGLPASHPGSFRFYMDQHLFSHVNIRPENIYFLDGAALDPDAVCREYEAAIRRAGGIALGILGLGPNGHIAFNEPGTPWESRTHRVVLTETTRRANAPFFPSPDQVPQWALTMGIGTIREVQRLLLLVTGTNKGEALAALYRGRPDPRWPVTALLEHPDVTVLVDAGTVPLPPGLTVRGGKEAR